MIKKCEHCKFHRYNPDHCRRVPPTTVDGRSSSYPPVAREWDCGEFRLSLRKLFSRKRYNLPASDGTVNS